MSVFMGLFGDPTPGPSVIGEVTNQNGDSIGFGDGVMGIYDDFMGFYGDLMGFDDDLMGF